ncbi:MAG: TonB-dependent receptor [Candidatus Kapabacteria bacterium]|nr:TonB-dependent receptor [Ignavibacteriota bacterium]MCW5883385.1 TonB-dependent receptor [Candidatus Kapabacteria bacterium]
MVTAKKSIFLLFVFFINYSAFSVDITGSIKSKHSKQPLVGATVRVDGTSSGAKAGLNGSYRIKNIKPGEYTLKVTYVGYEQSSQKISINDKDLVKIDFELEEKSVEGDEIFVFADKDISSEEGARASEKMNIGVSNIMTSSVISVSPDITVSTLIQKMPGVSIEEEGSNEGSYAIIRGMDKRYNNTLVNGIKIPSPDARNRFVPLDIFPSDLIGRLEVFKSVTPDMEADAIGGTVNLVMKNAPNDFLVQANAAVGYNDLFLDRDYLWFNTSVQRRRSPGRITEWNDNLSKQEKYDIVNKYFPLEASVFENRTALPNAIAGFTIGDRFGENKQFGAILALSYQSITRGQNSSSTNIDPERESGLTTLDNVYVRENSIHDTRIGIHNKLDYNFNPNHRISLYNAFMHLSQNEAWYLIDSSYFRLSFVRTVDYELFSQQIDQNIYNSTIRGDHNFGKNHVFDWSLSYALATRNQPDRATMRLNRKDVNDLNIHGDIRVDYDYQYVREFTYNSDQDINFITNLKQLSFISLGSSELRLENKIGTLIRFKNRENFYDQYTFRPYLNNSLNEYPGNQEYVYEGDVRNGDLRNTYFRLFNPNGSTGSTNEYTINELVGAAFLQSKGRIGDFEITAGVRAEYTDIEFETAAYRGPQSPANTKGSQDYLNILPGVFIKYMPNRKTNWRLSYNQALTRPSFYEFVPAIEINSDGEKFQGNPNVKNTVADNFDLRYEYYPSALDKIFVGVFYKHLTNPIERAYIGSGTFTFENFDEANNYGLEIEFTKYISQIGFRINYSYTSSQIESQKRFFFRLTEENMYLVDMDISGRLRQDLDAGTVNVGDLTNIIRNETRPLQGQTDHLFNFSILYKNQELGIDAQVDLNYQGERIVFVAPEYKLDWWQRPQINLDFSAEKKFGSFTLYFKSRNLLDTPREFYVKRPLVDLGVQMPFQDNPREETFARRNLFGRNMQIGIKYLFN